MLNRIWIPIKVSFEISKLMLLGKWIELKTTFCEETNDTYYYVNDKYICHEKEPFKIKE
jgi:hypothetical protein